MLLQAQLAIFFLIGATLVGATRDPYPNVKHRRRRSPPIRRRRTARRRWAPYEVVCSASGADLRAGARACRQGGSDLTVDWASSPDGRIKGTLLCEHPGAWRAADWGECSHECGSGTRQRQFICADSDGFGAYCNSTSPAEEMTCHEPEESGYPISTDVSSMMYGIGGIRDWVHWVGVILILTWCMGSAAGAALFGVAQKRDPSKANEIAMACFMQQMFAGCVLLIFSGAAWWNERRAGWFYLPHCLIDGADPKELGHGFPFFLAALPVHVILTSCMAFGPMFGDVKQLSKYDIAVLSRRQATKLLHDVVDAAPILVKESKNSVHEPLISWENGSTEDLHLDDGWKLFSSHSRVNAFIAVHFVAADVFTDKAMEKMQYHFTCRLNDKELQEVNSTPPSRTVHLQMLSIRHMIFRRCPLLNSYIPQWLASFTFTGLIYSVWDNFWGVPTLTFHMHKTIRILPNQDLVNLIEGSESSTRSSQVSSVEDWRSRALEALACFPLEGAGQAASRGRASAGAASIAAQAAHTFAAPACSAAQASAAATDPAQTCVTPRKKSARPRDAAKAGSAKKAAVVTSRGPEVEVLPGVMPLEVVPTPGSGSHTSLPQETRSNATVLGMAVNTLAAGATVPILKGSSSSAATNSGHDDPEIRQRWERNAVSRQDWENLILQAEIWVVRSHLRIANSGLDEASSAERATDIFVSSWQAGRLLPGAAQFKMIFDKVSEAFNQDFRQALACMDIDRLDRLKVLSDRAKDCSEGNGTYRMIDSRIGDVLVWHGRHMLEFAVKIGDRKALALAMIQSERICDDTILKVAHSDDRLAMDFLFKKARDMYRDKLYRDTHHMLSTDAGQELLGDQQESFRSLWVDKQLKPGHDFFANPRLKDEVDSPQFLRRIQALFDLTGRDVLTRDRQNSLVPWRLEVVRVKRSINLNTYKGYYARRREIQESLFTRELPEIQRIPLTVGASGCWASRALRQAQGCWTEAESGQPNTSDGAASSGTHWIVRGCRVYEAALVAACCLSPAMSEKLLSRHSGELGDLTTGDGATVRFSLEGKPILRWLQLPDEKATTSKKTWSSLSSVAKPRSTSPRSHSSDAPLAAGASSSEGEDDHASTTKAPCVWGSFLANGSTLTWVPPNIWRNRKATSASSPSSGSRRHEVTLEVHAAETGASPASSTMPGRRWVRASCITGEWLIGGRSVSIFPPALFAAGADLVDKNRGLDSYSSRVAGRVLRAPRGRAWFASEQQRIASLSNLAGREQADYLMHVGDRFFPLWLEPHSPDVETISFTSLTFRGNFHRSGHEIFVQGFGKTSASDSRSNKVVSMLTAAANSIKNDDPFSREEFYGYRCCFVAELGAKELDRRCNELYLFHGTREAAAESITDSDFKVNLAGTHRGTMFGPGIYLADSVTKSDEYTEEDANGLRTIVICRVTMGRMLEQSEGEGRMCLTRCQRGGYHSVLGLRAYNEYVVYDEQQVYAEYIVWYKRLT